MKHLQLRVIAAAVLYLTFLALPVGNASAATPTYYTDRTTFEATLTTSITDDYAPPTYPAGFNIYDNATMSAFLGETEYETTGWLNWNFTTDERYCSGCNGSFRLSFQNTSVTDGGVGVYGAGFDVSSHNSSTLRYYAFITFGDGTTDNVALPDAGSFFGVTAPELIESIHVGLSGGGTTTSGSIIIDNLTIGQNGDAPPPAPPTPVPALGPLGLVLLALMLGAGAFRSRRRI